METDADNTLPSPEAERSEEQRNDYNQGDGSDAPVVGAVYDTAKGLWGWGRTVPVAGAVLGLWEGAASAALWTATGGTMDLPDLDAELRSRIGGLDRTVVNPALRRLLRFLMQRDRTWVRSIEVEATRRGRMMRAFRDRTTKIDKSFNNRAAKAAAHARRLRVIVAAPLRDLVGEERRPPVHPKSARDADFIKEALSESVLFSKLTKSVRRQLLDAFEPWSVQKGTTVIRQGDEGDYFYVVWSGIICIYVDGKRAGTRLAGDSFGELALLYDCPRAATCIAETDGRLFRLDRDTFRLIVETYNVSHDRETKELLGKVGFLKDFEDNILERIACSLMMKTFDTGDIILRKGDKADLFCLVKEGKVRATDVTIGGRSYEACTFGPGEHFGDEAIVQNSPYFGNVVALDKTTVVCISRVEFIKLMGPFKTLIVQNFDQKLLKAMPIANRPQLTQSNIEVLASAIVDHDFEKDHIFFTEGEAVAPALFLVRSGTVHLTSSNGEDNLMTEGGYFGNETLGGNISVPTAAKHTIIAKERCTIGVLTADDINSVIGCAKSPDISVDEILKHHIIGAGTFGVVWCASMKCTEDVYALKVQYKRQLVDSGLVETAIREKNMMAAIRSEFVITLVANYQDDHRLFMLMKLYQGGELWSVIHTDERHGVPESAAKFYAANILIGLTHMHCRRILHRDMKPANVLIDDDGYAIIIDLGTAKFVPGKTYTLCGTPLYLAPEVIQRSGHDKGADLWSWGIILYEMMFGMTPFDDPDTIDQMEIFKKILSGSFDFPDGSGISPLAMDLINQILVVRPPDRLGSLAGAVIDIHRHPWFQDIDFEKVANKDVNAPWMPDIKDKLDTTHFEAEGYVENACWEELPLSGKEQEMFRSF